MKNILGGNGFATNAGIGKGHVFRNIRVEVVTDHQHIEMLVNRVDRVGPRWIRRRWQHMGFATGTDNIRRVATTGALGVIGMNGSPLKCREGIFDKTGLIKRIGMNRYLDVVTLRDTQTIIN